MGKLKTGGFNFQDLEKDNTDLGTMFNMGEKNMGKELRIKKKRKWNFDKLFPVPANNENMGMDNFGKGKPFEGLI